MDASGSPQAPEPTASPQPQQPAAAAAANLDAPLQRPTLRVSGNDIILEEGDPPASSSREAAATPDVRTISFPRTPGGVTPSTPVPVLDFSQLNKQASRKSTQSQLVNVGSRNTNKNVRSINTELGKSNGIGSFRLRFDTELQSSSPMASEDVGGDIAWKELTIENMERFAKCGGGPPTRSDCSARLWRWLTDAGPPYEVQPSVGVNTRPPPKAASLKNKSSGGIKRFSCFPCFA